VGQQNIFEHAIIGGLLTKLNQMCEKNLTLPEQLGAQHVCMQHQCHKPVNERVLSEKGWMVLETFWSFLGLR